jgi:hypothetical protein
VKEKKCLVKVIKSIILYLVPVPGTVINYGSGSDFLTSYGSGSTRQKVTVPTVPVPVPQHCSEGLFICKKLCKCTIPSKSNKKKNCAKIVVGVLKVNNENSRIRIH